MDYFTIQRADGRFIMRRNGTFRIKKIRARYHIVRREISAIRSVARFSTFKLRRDARKSLIIANEAFKEGIHFQWEQMNKQAQQLMNKQAQELMEKFGI